MSPIEPVWLFGAIALACGILLGVLINRLLNPSAGDIEQLKADLERERDEMKRYKTSVNAHFNKTSSLVKELTQDYVKVYQHLAEGAQTLSDSPEFSQVLEQPQGRVLISVEDGSSATPAVDADAAASKPAGPVAADAAAAAATVALKKDEPATAADTAAADNAWAPVESTRVADENKTQAVSTDAGSEAVTEATEKAVADAGETRAPGNDETAAVKKARSADSAEPVAAAADETATGPAKTKSRSKPVT